MSSSKIGPYKLLHSIAKGGMGEVFLAEDPDCKRQVALKRIRSELAHNPIIYKRFVKEALIASRLTHPNIIPIYTLSNDGEKPFYTMPYIEGQTLKQILLKTYKQQKDSKNFSSTKGSIPELINIFLTVCEAVAYAHENHIIHRDLKPENILIGKHGEILIFDWGVADKIENIAKEDPSYALEEAEFPGLTSPGKIIGTLSFLAPERFLGEPANYQTDIYSLGVMLYMILTLRLPFRRKKVSDAKKNLHKEVYRNPIDVAPYRDIPHALVKISKKCLEKDPSERYQNMQELLKDLRNFTEAQSEWILVKKVNHKEASDWSFKESVLVSNHQAISSNQNALEWIQLAISRSPFDIHCQIETTVELKEGCHGIGLLISSPHASKRVHVIDGYYLWLSADKNQPSKLFRNNVEVLKIDHLTLNINTPYNIRLEKINNRLQLYLDEVKQFSYLSYLPLIGHHIGILYKDLLFSMEPLKISVASPSLINSCLQIPDSFLAEKHYNKAIEEYRKIGRTFPGRHESREAFFRAGLAILQQASHAKNRKAREVFFDQSLTEFEQLRHTPGAPLEYLGKALVYQEMQDCDEELKCLELAIRRYPNHPLLYLIYDHIIYRLYQSSHSDRIDAHQFVFLALRYNAIAQHQQMIDPLVLNLTDRKHMLFFLEKTNSTELQSHYLDMIISLCFLLKKSYVYQEILDEYSLDPHFVRNILINCWLLGEKELFNKYQDLIEPDDQEAIQKLKETLTISSTLQLFGESQKPISSFGESIFFLLIEKGLMQRKYQEVLKIFELMIERGQVFLKGHEFYYYYIISALLAENLETAKSIFTNYQRSLEEVPDHLLFIESCIMAVESTPVKARDFLFKKLEGAPPDIENLGMLFLSDQLKQKKWEISAFEYEKSQLYKQLYFFFQIANNNARARSYLKKWKKAFNL